jgi:HAD superfamily hydrolase (TIGR01509 family)
MTVGWDAVVFDLGGVLIEWDPRYLYRRLLEEDEVERFLTTVCTAAWNAEQDAGRSFREGVDALVERFPEQADLVRAYRERWEEMLGDPVPGAEELVADVIAAGVRCFALTNWSAETFPIARGRFPWLARFEGIVVSGEEGVIKPDARLYRMLLDRFSLQADRCVFVDDVPANTRAASALGFRSIEFGGIDDLRGRLVRLGVLETGGTSARLSSPSVDREAGDTVSQTTVEDPVVLTEDLGPVRRLTMNRPRSLNALNGELIDGLSRALALAADDEGVRVVILRGAGRAFCAGYDLNEDAAGGTLDSAHWHAELARSTARMLELVDHPKPVIAQVHSYCLAGGTDLMLACDLAVAADDAFFGYVDVRFGSGVVSMFLPWIVGVRKAKELLFTGEDRIPANEALRVGLVNRVVPADLLEGATLAVADQIAKNEPFVVQTTKRALNRAWDAAGFRAAMAANTDLDAIIETANLPQRDEFRRITSERGLKAAIAWRDARFRGEEA